MLLNLSPSQFAEVCLTAASALLWCATPSVLARLFEYGPIAANVWKLSFLAAIFAAAGGVWSLTPDGMPIDVVISGFVPGATASIVLCLLDPSRFRVPAPERPIAEHFRFTAGRIYGGLLLFFVFALIA
ncbi:MAG: hypothetical protein IT290_06665 [Deltaproteobacteria bacterium]|nr:hypothetical protein [Deltaproteobacteria bacterium]